MAFRTSSLRGLARWAPALCLALVALVAAVAVQLITTWVYRGEEDLLDACTQYCNDNVISRLRLTDL